MCVAKGILAFRYNRDKPLWLFELYLAFSWLSWLLEWVAPFERLVGGEIRGKGVKVKGEGEG